jgi:hypothetical protein
MPPCWHNKILLHWKCQSLTLKVELYKDSPLKMRRGLWRDGRSAPCSRWREKMYLRASRHLLSLNQAQISLAFRCLAEQSLPPEDLHPLSIEDWMLLAVLLENLLEEKRLNVLH